jgi:hypothetical protein
MHTAGQRSTAGADRLLVAAITSTWQQVHRIPRAPRSRASSPSRRANGTPSLQPTERFSGRQLDRAYRPFYESRMQPVPLRPLRSPLSRDALPGRAFSAPRWGRDPDITLLFADAWGRRRLTSDLGPPILSPNVHRECRGYYGAVRAVRGEQRGRRPRGAGAHRGVPG